MNNLEKSSIIRITSKEYNDFFAGVVPEKLLSWNLTTAQFAEMVVSGQIQIENTEMK